MTRMLLGAVAGLTATIPMTVFWEAMHKRLAGEPPRPLPPREVVEGLAVKAGISRVMSERDMELAALGAHFGYGTLAGAAFGVVAPTQLSRSVAGGMLFGLGVWAVSYGGWLPATGIRHSPRYDVPTRTRLIVASHLVWGAAAGVVLSAISPRR